MTAVHASSGLAPTAAAAAVRVAFVVTDLLSGGAEHMLVRLLTRLPRERVTPFVFSLGGEGEFGDELRAAGVPVRAAELKKSGGVRRALALRDVVRAVNPAVIQGWMYHGNVAARLARIGGVPVVWSIHYSLDHLAADPFTTRALIRGGRWISTDVARIIYCSRESRRQHERLGYEASRGMVIPNAVDCSEYRPDPGARARARESLGVEPDDVLVGTFAHLRPMKDHATLLRAFAYARMSQPRLRLVLAGRDVTSDEPSLRSLHHELQLGDDVLYLGQRSDVPALLPALDAFCLSSAFGEAFPVAVAEAMACGVPAIVTPVGDSAELVGDTGTVVAARDPETLGKAMADFARRTPGEREAQGRAARARVCEHFSIEQYVTRHLAVFETLAAVRR